MKIIKLKDKCFGTQSMYRKVSGYTFYEESKGYIAFTSDRDQYGILVPYIPIGGKMALEAILADGGFVSFEGMEYVVPIEMQMKRYHIGNGTGSIADFDTAAEVNKWFDEQVTNQKYFCRIYDREKNINILGSEYMWLKPSERWSDEPPQEQEIKQSQGFTQTMY